MSYHFNLFDQVAGATVREVVYETGHHLFHHTSTATMIVIAIVVIGVVYLLSRARPRRRW
jgi:uncharacterized membrane protein (DUF2068 family)